MIEARSGFSETVYLLTRELFFAVGRLRSTDESSLPPPAQFHAAVKQSLDKIAEDLRTRGLSRRNTEDILYALVALTDETALMRGAAMRQYWLSHVLQVAYFGEHNAGEGFFNRLEALKTGPRGTAVLLVYYLCLLHGFQGRYSVKEGDFELRKLTSRVRGTLLRSGTLVEPLPSRESLVSPPSPPRVKHRLSWVTMGACVACLLLHFGLFLDIQSRVRVVTARMASIAEPSHSTLEGYQ